MLDRSPVQPSRLFGPKWVAFVAAAQFGSRLCGAARARVHYATVALPLLARPALLRVAALKSGTCRPRVLRGATPREPRARGAPPRSAGTRSASRMRSMTAPSTSCTYPRWSSSAQSSACASCGRRVGQPLWRGYAPHCSHRASPRSDAFVGCVRRRLQSRSLRTQGSTRSGRSSAITTDTRAAPTDRPRESIQQ